MNVNHGITDTGKLKTIEIDKYEPIPDKPGRCRAVGQASKHRIYTQRVLSTALGKLFFCLFKRELSGRLPIIPVVVFGIKRPDVKAECRNIPFGYHF